MKLPRIATCMATFGLLAACASVHGPRQSGLSQEQQARRERAQMAKLEGGPSPGQLAASTTTCAGFAVSGEERKYTASGFQWRYKPTLCNRQDIIAPPPFLNSTSY